MPSQGRARSEALLHTRQRGRPCANQQPRLATFFCFRHGFVRCSVSKWRQARARWHRAQTATRSEPVSRDHVNEIGRLKAKYLTTLTAQITWADTSPTDTSRPADATETAGLQPHGSSARPFCRGMGLPDLQGIKEVLRRWSAEQSLHQIARETRLDRKTVRRYVKVAESSHSRWAGVRRRLRSRGCRARERKRALPARTSCPRTGSAGHILVRDFRAQSELRHAAALRDRRAWLGQTPADSAAP
jgi:hypothetical protein